MRGPGRGLVRAGLVLFGLGAFFVSYLYAIMPLPGPERIAAGPELVGVHTGQSYAWLLRTARGAVLIDAGMDAEAPALVSELAKLGVSPDQVHTLLVTHGHLDHWGGWGAFPNARVYVGPGEAAVLSRERPLRAPIGQVLRRLSWPPVPASLAELEDGATLLLDGEEIRALHLPGHTPGSMAYLWRDVLFTGDAVLGKREGLVAAPWFLSEDPAQGRASLRRLLTLDFERIADGHSGLVSNGRAKLERLLAE